MIHNHNRDHNHDHQHGNTGNLRLAFFLNLTFTLLEIAGGLWTNSMAILSDAVHDLGDSLSLGVAWYLEKISEKGCDRRYSYGYRRFSVLGALFTTMVLLGGGLLVLMRAIPRLINPEETNAPGMIAFAILGILVNGVAALRLKRGQSLSEQAVAWHLLEDVLGWAAVLVVGIVMLFVDLPILDPILSVLITLYVLYNTFRNLRRSLAVFLQAVPDGIDIEVIETRLLALDKVESVHHTHVWSMDGYEHVLSTHVVVEASTTRDEILCVKEEIRQLRGEFNLAHTTVEVEYYHEGCVMTA